MGCNEEMSHRSRKDSDPHSSSYDKKYKLTNNVRAYTKKSYNIGKSQRSKTKQKDDLLKQRFTWLEEVDDKALGNRQRMVYSTHWLPIP